MKTKRAHVLLPYDLIREIDAIVGPRGRSAFLVETAQEAVRQRKLLQFLESDAPGWKDADHPELSRGAGAWVRQLRRESDKRITKKSRRAGK
jgi:hypothetical protein